MNKIIGVATLTIAGGVIGAVAGHFMIGSAWAGVWTAAGMFICGMLSRWGN